MKPTDLKCRPQVVAVIGETLADYELGRVIDCPGCDTDNDYRFGFSRTDSPQGHQFWNCIEDGQNPYDHGHEKPEVKEWVYIHNQYLDFEDEWFYKKDGKWIASDGTFYQVGYGDIKVLATHKSVTMPDWVPELSEITPPFEKEGKEVLVPKSESGEKERSDGSTASYYELPEGATELQHLISHRNQNGQIAEIFRACYRYGLVSHSDMLRDAKKIKFYAQAEIERLEKLASASE